MISTPVANGGIAAVVQYHAATTKMPSMTRASGLIPPSPAGSSVSAARKAIDPRTGPSPTEAIGHQRALTRPATIEASGRYPISAAMRRILGKSRESALDGSGRKGFFSTENCRGRTTLLKTPVSFGQEIIDFLALTDLHARDPDG